MWENLTGPLTSRCDGLLHLLLNLRVVEADRSVGEHKRYPLTAKPQILQHVLEASECWQWRPVHHDAAWDRHNFSIIIIQHLEKVHVHNTCVLNMYLYVAMLGNGTHRCVWVCWCKCTCSTHCTFTCTQACQLSQIYCESHEIGIILMVSQAIGQISWKEALSCKNSSLQYLPQRLNSLASLNGWSNNQIHES